MTIRRALFAIGLLFASCTAALAQSNCSYIATGAVLTAAQWNQCFAQKQNVIGYTPVNKAGDTMLGRLTTVPSSSIAAGFNLTPGTAPTSPGNGDLWMTSAGFFARVNGVTVSFPTASSASFDATSPLTVSFPSSVVTYAFDFTVANTFKAQQSFSLNSGTLPSAITGTVIRAGQASGTTSRIVSEGYGAIAALTVARADGTAAIPTQVLSGEQIGGFNAFAWGSNAAWNGPIASLRVYTAENITATAWGSRVCIGTAPVTTAAIVDGLCQQNDGGIIIASPTGGSKGSGTINAAGLIYSNGNAVASSATSPIVLNATTGVVSCPTCSTSSFANPTASVGLTAVNGSATTSMRSDAAPALSQAITPNMTGAWAWTNNTLTALTVQDASSSQDKLTIGVTTTGGYLSGGPGLVAKFTPNTTASTNQAALVGVNSRVVIQSDGGVLQPQMIIADTVLSGTNPFGVPVYGNTSGDNQAGFGFVANANVASIGGLQFDIVNLGPANSADARASSSINLYGIKAVGGGVQNGVFCWNMTGTTWNAARSGMLAGDRICEFGAFAYASNGFPQTENVDISFYMEANASNTAGPPPLQANITAPTNIVLHQCPRSGGCAPTITHVFDADGNHWLGPGLLTNGNGNLGGKGYIVFNGASGTPTSSVSGGSILFSSSGNLSVRNSGEVTRNIATVSSATLNNLAFFTDSHTITDTGFPYTRLTSAVALSVMGNCTTSTAAVTTTAAGAAGDAAFVINTAGTSCGWGKVQNSGLQNPSMTIAGHSISLGGTQTLSLTDLTDYSTGSWTPAIIGSVTPGSGQAYSVQVGSYERIGRLVIARFYVVATSLGTASGNIVVSGLPVAVANVTNDIGQCQVSFYLVNGLVVADAGLTGVINPSASTITIYQNSVTGSTALTVTQAGASVQIAGTCIYRSS